VKALYVAGISAGLLLLVVTGCGRSQQAPPKTAGAAIPVEGATVATREIQREVEAVCTMYPYDEVIVSAEIEGRVETVNADLGDRVRQGQVLVQVSEEEQRYLLAQNEAQLRQSLERLGLKSEDDRVSNIRETPEVRRAHADLVEAELRHTRVRDLVSQGVASQQELDQASARFKALQADYDATLNQTRNLIQEVERYKALVALQRKKLRDTSIRAPFDAYVKQREVTIGAYLTPNAPVMRLVRIDPIRLRVEVPEHMAPHIHVNQVALVTVEAFAGRTFEGKIWRISPTVDENKRSFIVEALISNPAGDLKPGFYARARIATSKRDQIRLVPARSVNYVLGTNKVYVVQGDIIQAREVRLGDRVGEFVEVVDGVSEGEIVAATEVLRLDTGSRVKVVRMAQAGEGAPAPGSNAGGRAVPPT